MSTQNFGVPQTWRQRICEAAGVSENALGDWPSWMRRITETVYNDGSEKKSRVVLDEELFRRLRVFRDAGPEARDAIEAAYALGGLVAVRDLIESLLHESLTLFSRGAEKKPVASGRKPEACNSCGGLRDHEADCPAIKGF